MPSVGLLRIIKPWEVLSTLLGNVALTLVAPPPRQVGTVTLRSKARAGVGRENQGHPARMGHPKLIRKWRRSEPWRWEQHGALTGDADIGPAALGGARRAPGHALAPVILQAKQLLHLLPGHLDLHLPHQKPCKGTEARHQMGRSMQEQGN